MNIKIKAKILFAGLHWFPQVRGGSYFVHFASSFRMFGGYSRNPGHETQKYGSPHDSKGEIDTFHISPLLRAGFRNKRRTKSPRTGLNGTKNLLGTGEASFFGYACPPAILPDLLYAHLKCF